MKTARQILEETNFFTSQEEEEIIIAMMEEYANQSKWIPVSERLPEKEDADKYNNVLVCRYDGRISPCPFYNIGNISVITHWIPVPELPNK